MDFFSRPRRKIIHSSKLESTRHQLYTNLHKKCIARISLTTYFPREHQPYFSGILGYPVFYDCDKKRTENEWYFCLIGDSVHTQFVSLLFSMQSHPRPKKLEVLLCTTWTATTPSVLTDLRKATVINSLFIVFGKARKGFGIWGRRGRISLFFSHLV